MTGHNYYRRLNLSPRYCTALWLSLRTYSLLLFASPSSPATRGRGRGRGLGRRDGGLRLLRPVVLALPALVGGQRGAVRDQVVVRLAVVAALRQRVQRAARRQVAPEVTAVVASEADKHRIRMLPNQP
jgi:hypothetical protein